MGTGSFPGVKRPGHGIDHPRPSYAKVKERIELYLYSPYGPYGLYRSSVPVQGCNLPFLLDSSMLVALLMAAINETHVRVF
jgi:hypothetical protein